MVLCYSPTLTSLCISQYRHRLMMIMHRHLPWVHRHRRCHDLVTVVQDYGIIPQSSPVMPVVILLVWVPVGIRSFLWRVPTRVLADYLLMRPV